MTAAHRSLQPLILTCLHAGPVTVAELQRSVPLAHPGVSAGDVQGAVDALLRTGRVRLTPEGLRRVPQRHPEPVFVALP